MFPLLIIALLLLWSLAVGFAMPWLVRLAQAALALAGLAFAGLTLRLQGQRGGRAPMQRVVGCVPVWSRIFALCMLLTAALAPKLAELPGWSLFFGILLIAGGFLPFIIGMLYKIVPFLPGCICRIRGRASCRRPT